MAKRFLSAKWLDLLLVTWKVPKELLQDRLPRGVELDLYEGSPLVSLVAFDFRDTKVFGMKWPGFTNFPELNLRFYIRANGQRGVCFIREFVPSRLVAGLARALYNEPYSGVSYQRDEKGHRLTVGGQEHRIFWEKSGELFLPEENTIAHFLKEHELGVGQRRSGEALAYKVEHPIWRIWPKVDIDLDVDFGKLYGDEWAMLGEQKPFSVVAAEGSEIAVYGAEKL